MQSPPNHDDVVPVYANNVRLEMSARELRMFFGQLLAGNSGGEASVDWHTDISIPWAKAKLMSLYLGINVAIYEAENGKISIPPSVLPQPVTTPPPGIDPANPQ